MLLEFTYFIFNIHFKNKKKNTVILQNTLYKKAHGSWDLRRSQVTRLVWDFG